MTSVFLVTGFVMESLTVKMVVMNHQVVLPRYVQSLNSNVTTMSIVQMSGRFVTVKTIVEITLMRRAVLDVQPTNLSMYNVTCERMKPTLWLLSLKFHPRFTFCFFTYSSVKVDCRLGKYVTITYITECNVWMLNDITCRELSVRWGNNSNCSVILGLPPVTAFFSCT